MVYGEREVVMMLLIVGIKNIGYSATIMAGMILVQKDKPEVLQITASEAMETIATNALVDPCIFEPEGVSPVVKPRRRRKIDWGKFPKQEPRVMNTCRVFRGVR